MKREDNGDEKRQKQSTRIAEQLRKERRSIKETKVDKRRRPRTTIRLKKKKRDELSHAVW
jgi:hypothetical protein